MLFDQSKGGPELAGKFNFGKNYWGHKSLDAQTPKVSDFLANFGTKSEMSCIFLILKVGDKKVFPD